MADSRFLALPEELQEHVFSFASLKTLASLQQTCRLFNELAENYLCSSIHLSSPWKARTFDAAVEHDTRRMRAVREVEVDYQTPDRSSDARSACTLVPLFQKFPKLQCLSLRSNCSYKDDQWHRYALHDAKSARESPAAEQRASGPTKWRTDQDILCKTLQSASLLTSPEARIWKHLRSITLDFCTASHGRISCVFDASLFLIEHLTDLTLRGLVLSSEDFSPLEDSAFRGRTQLKKLALETCSIDDVVALHHCLCIPQALTHLTMEHDAGIACWTDYYPPPME